MQKVLFALKDMNIGGVEKSLISLLNEIDQDKYDNTVLLLRNYGGFINHIPSWVKVKILDDYSKIDAIVNNNPLFEIKRLFRNKEKLFSFQLLIGYIYYKLTEDMRLYYYFAFKKIKPLEEEYDIAISYTSIISYLSYFVNYKVKARMKIGWIHFDVSKISLIKKTMLKLHNDYFKIYIVSKEGYNNFVEIFPELEQKCEIKYNVISSKYIKELANHSIDDMKCKGIKIVTLGRLSYEKGQDMIPEIAYRLKQQSIEFKWYLIGDGNLNKNILEYITKFDLQDYVILLGTKDNPYPYLKNADLYVQTSRYEGYCISLAEARVFELPIVTTNFVGANEQLINNITGKIVSIDIDDLYNAIYEITKDSHLRDLYRKNLRKENAKNEN